MTASRRYALVSFDLDGTLVDTAAEIAEAANRTLDELGLRRESEAAIARLIGAGTRELMLALLRAVPGGAEIGADAARRDEALGRFALHYDATAGSRCVAYPSARVALDRLRRGGVRLACVTNKEERFSGRVLAACGCGDAFDLVIGGDTLPVKKPDAGVLEHAMRALGVEPDATAHVGDSRIDIEAARNAGVSAWAVPYGYNGGEPVAACHPDRMFRDLGEVADLVLVAPDS